MADDKRTTPISPKEEAGGGSLHDHIENTAAPYGYDRIMLEFARVPRSVWRAVKERSCCRWTRPRLVNSRCRSG